MIFKYADLEGFLADCRDRLRVTTLRDWDGGPALILRHDVDLDIEPAYQLMRLEERVGVRSSFFVLVSGHTYNPASRRNRSMLRAMAEAGFEIGLHFDPLIYGETSAEKLARMVHREADFLGSVVDRPVVSVSLHNPSIYNQFPLFPEFRNAYDPAIFGPDRYLSDSRMEFRRPPLAFADEAAESVRQLLLHPLHYTPEGSGYREIMHRYTDRLLGCLDEDFSVNTTYARLLSAGARSFLAALDPDRAKEND